MTPLRWNKMGLVIQPQKNLWWSRTHAMIPTGEFLSENHYKIYFSGRDDKNRSHIGFAIVDLREPEKVLEYSSEPILAPGDLGCFDDNGVTPSCVVNVGNEKFLYYIGWNPGSTVRMHLFGGLAISQDQGKTFKRFSRAPIIERTAVNPFLNTAPFVLHENGDWKMYYVSGVGWVHKDLPRYNIQLATSKDGKSWHREGHVCIDFQSPSENALARPCVIKENGLYKMFFAHKGEAYRMGYAESHDGIHWNRNDSDAGLTVSPNGFDSEMVEYAWVIPFKGRKIVYYNGNNYGSEGIGLAISNGDSQ